MDMNIKKFLSTLILAISFLSLTNGSVYADEEKSPGKKLDEGIEKTKKNAQKIKKNKKQKNL